METSLSNKCKAFTSLEQSQALAEILPLDSADMFWSRCTITDFGDGVLKVSYAVEPCNISQFRNTKEDVPCWSLAALLEQFEDVAGLAKEYGLWFCYDNRKLYCTKHYDNPVDACVEMILKLHKEGVL